MTTSEPDPKNYGAPWTRDELVLALDLYCRIPFRQTKATNPQVVSLARLIGRSPAGVARKLGNFGAFDPELQRRGVSGISSASTTTRPCSVRTDSCPIRPTLRGIDPMFSVSNHMGRRSSGGDDGKRQSAC